MRRNNWSPVCRCHAVRSSFAAQRNVRPASPRPPASPTVPRSNANSTEQTGSGGSRRQPKLSAPVSLARDDRSSLLSPAIAAELIEQSTFAVGSAFSQSMILAKGDDSGTLTGKTSQFKSSGATFTANSIDTSSGESLCGSGFDRSRSHRPECESYCSNMRWETPPLQHQSRSSHWRPRSHRPFQSRITLLPFRPANLIPHRARPMC